MAQAQWQVLIDWNDDGDFSDPDEDVTAAVLGLTLEHFRDLAGGHIEAARLELELKNEFQWSQLRRGSDRFRA